MKARMKLEDHQKTAAHHVYVGFAAGVIITAGITLIVFAIMNSYCEVGEKNNSQIKPLITENQF